MWYSCCHRPQVQWPQLGFTWRNPQTFYTTHFCSILRWGQGFSTPGFVSLHHNVCLTSASSPLCLTHHDSSPWHLTQQWAYCFCSATAWSPGQHNVSHPSFYLLSTSGIFYLNSPNYPNPEPHHREGLSRSERTWGPELATLLALRLARLPTTWYISQSSEIFN